MFKRSKRKIVAAILSVLVLLLAGTLCVIYAASYIDMTNENQEMLRQYVQSYTLPGSDVADSSGPGSPEANSFDQGSPEADSFDPGSPGAGSSGTASFETIDPGTGSFNTLKPHEDPNNPKDKPPMLELSTFYSVALTEDGEVLKADTADISTFTEEELSALALEIVESGKSSSVRSNLAYRMEQKDGYILVAFLDNTVVLESAGTLFNYTLIFGSVTLVLMFFLARCLAERIVAPLEESYKKQKQFISDAGHELKTPAAVINANLDLLSRQIGPNQWLSNIQYENERMSDLIIQLLDLARTENAAPSMEDLDFSRLALGESLPLETVAYEKGLSLKTEIEDDIRVSGNSVQLKQLTSILIDNALRHSTAGSEILLSLKKEKHHAVLSVTNDGEPLTLEQRRHVFERFYRTDEARSGTDKHYGLGLAIAKAVVTAHKGSITVRCAEGKIIFTAKLPLVK